MTYESLPDLVEQLVDRWNDVVEQRGRRRPPAPRRGRVRGAAVQDVGAGGAAEPGTAVAPSQRWTGAVSHATVTHGGLVHGP